MHSKCVLPIFIYIHLDTKCIVGCALQSDCRVTFVCNIWRAWRDKWISNRMAKRRKKKKNNIIVRTPPQPLSIAYFTALNTSLWIWQRDRRCRRRRRLFIYIYSSCRTQQFRPFLLFLFRPRCRFPNLTLFYIYTRQYFVVLFSYFFSSLSGRRRRAFWKIAH